MLPAGPDAHVLALAGWVMTGVLGVATLIVGALVVVGALRNKGSLLEHAPVNAGGGKSWILYGGLLLPAIVFGGFFVYAMTVLGSTPALGNSALPVIKVTGHQWWWDVEYVFGEQRDNFHTANELHIPVGQTITVTTQTADVIHSFWVPQLNGKMDLIPGHIGTVRLSADKAGVYRGECAEYCGTQHAHMAFQVVAESPAEFRAWLMQQRALAAAPGDPVALRGQEAFNTHACVLCHTIRGTPAQGQVAPDLTHLASRRTIAAATLPNHRAGLQAWVINAQSIKPGVAMPSLTDFDGPTLNALVTYLQSLR
jgi:cytochrome c oxidase subunit 2